VSHAGLILIIQATTGRVPVAGSAVANADEEALAAQAFRPQANLRIQSVELYAAPM
jgi:hypothetical protein